MFFTTSRIVVMSTERVLWTGFFIMIGAIVVFVVLFVRSLIMLVAGMFIAVGIGFLFSLVNPFIRRMSAYMKFRRVLRRGNIIPDLPYSSVVRVERKQVKMHVHGGLIWYMIPRPAEVRFQNVIEFTTSLEKSYSFILGSKEFGRCVRLIHKILADKVA